MKGQGWYRFYWYFAVGEFGAAISAGTKAHDAWTTGPEGSWFGWLLLTAILLIFAVQFVIKAAVIRSIQMLNLAVRRLDSERGR